MSRVTEFNFAAVLRCSFQEMATFVDVRSGGKKSQKVYIISVAPPTGSRWHGIWAKTVIRNILLIILRHLWIYLVLYVTFAWFHSVLAQTPIWYINGLSRPKLHIWISRFDIKASNDITGDSRYRWKYNWTTSHSQYWGLLLKHRTQRNVFFIW